MLEIGAIVWGVRDLPRATTFWSDALHYKLKREPDVDWAILVPREGDSLPDTGRYLNKRSKRLRDGIVNG